MTRGGLRRDSRGTTDHLFKNKWRLGKTTAIRIPEVLKDLLMSIAKHLDKSELALTDSDEILKRLTEYKKLQSNADFYRNEFLKLKEKNLELSQQISNQSNQNSFENKYQIAVKCFEEFVEKQGLDFDDLSKSRKGTKKHQLWMIREWFESQKTD